MSYYGRFNIFADVDFDSCSRARLEQLKETIHGENADYIVNVNPSVYVGHLISSFSIEPLILHLEQMEASSHEELIPAEGFPFNYNVYRGKSYPKQVIKYHIPVSGELELLKCVPNPRVLMTHEVSVESGAVCFAIVDFSGKPDDIKRQAESVVGTLKTQSGHLADNVATFNT